MVKARAIAIPFCLVLTMMMVATSVTAQRVASGGRHSLAICADGSVATWGFNGHGQRGNGTVTESAQSTRVDGLTSVRAVTGGLFHSLFLMADSTVRACGRNTQGQLGDGTITNATTPVTVAGLSGIVAISGGGEHSLFVRSDGTVWACGSNTSGQLGDGTRTSRREAPVQVRGLTNIVQAAAGAEFSLFLGADGRVWSCGHNGSMQLGTGTREASNTPVLIERLPPIRWISAGEWHSVFVAVDGTVLTCGNNRYGQLGGGTIGEMHDIITVSELTDIVEADAGGIHTVFVKRSGTVYACGLNSGGNNTGQLGDGSATDRHTPAVVIPAWGDGVVIAAQASRENTIYLLADGRVFAAGRNNYAQLGTGRTSVNNASTPVESSDVCTVLPLSVTSDPADASMVGLYPNPTTGHTTLRFSRPLNHARVTVYDAFGNSVLQRDGINGSSAVLELTDRAAGAYHVTVADGNGTYWTTMVIFLP